MPNNFKHTLSSWPLLLQTTLYWLSMMTSEAGISICPQNILWFKFNCREHHVLNISGGQAHHHLFWNALSFLYTWESLVCSLEILCLRILQVWTICHVQTLTNPLEFIYMTLPLLRRLLLSYGRSRVLWVKLLQPAAAKVKHFSVFFIDFVNHIIIIIQIILLLGSFILSKKQVEVLSLGQIFARLLACSLCPERELTSFGSGTEKLIIAFLVSTFKVRTTMIPGPSVEIRIVRLNFFLSALRKDLDLLLLRRMVLPISALEVSLNFLHLPTFGNEDLIIICYMICLPKIYSCSWDRVCFSCAVKIIMVKELLKRIVFNSGET